MNLEDLISKLKQVEGIDVLKSVLDLYAQHRMPGAVSSDDDMLLYQWGIFDWGEGEYFELDVTRQISSSKSEDIQQLSCTLFFHPSRELKNIEAGNRWCSSLAELASFNDFILDSEAFRTCSTIKPVKAEIEVGYV